MVTAIPNTRRACPRCNMTNVISRYGELTCASCGWNAPEPKPDTSINGARMSVIGSARHFTIRYGGSKSRYKQELAQIEITDKDNRVRVRCPICGSLMQLGLQVERKYSCPLAHIIKLVLPKDGFWYWTDA